MDRVSNFLHSKTCEIKCTPNKIILDFQNLTIQLILLLTVKALSTNPKLLVYYMVERVMVI